LFISRTVTTLLNPARTLGPVKLSSMYRKCIYLFDLKGMNVDDFLQNTFLPKLDEDSVDFLEISKMMINTDLNDGKESIHIVENRNKITDSDSTVLFDFNSGTPSPQLLKTDLEIYSKICKSKKIDLFSDPKKWIEIGLSTISEQNSLLNIFLRVCDFEGKVEVNELHYCIAVNTSPPKCDIDWILKIRIQLFALFLKWPTENTENISQKQNENKNKTVNKTVNENENRENSAWLLSFSFCALLTDLIHTTPRNSDCARENNSKIRSQSYQRNNLKMNSKKRKVFLSKIFEKLNTLHDTPLNSVTNFISGNFTCENSLEIGEFFDFFLADFIPEILSILHSANMVEDNSFENSDLILANNYMTKNIQNKNNFRNSKRHQNLDSGKAVVLDIFLLLLSDLTITQIINSGVWEIICLKNRKLGADLVMKSFEYLNLNKFSLEYFASSLKGEYSKEPIFTKTSNDRFLNQIWGENEKENHFDFIMKTYNNNTIINFKRILKSYEKKNNTVINNIQKESKMVFFLLLFGEIISSYPRDTFPRNMFSKNILKNITIEMDHIIRSTINLELYDIEGKLLKFTGYDLFDMISAHTEQSATLSSLLLLRQYINSINKNTDSLYIQNSQVHCTNNEKSVENAQAISVPYSDYGNNNKLKKIFHAKSQEIQKILRNHLRILFLCEERNGFFLCPAELNLLTAAPKIETSVLSSDGNFVLGKTLLDLPDKKNSLFYHHHFHFFFFFFFFFFFLNCYFVDQ
jgi:hypothetical protein